MQQGCTRREAVRLLSLGALGLGSLSLGFPSLACGRPPAVPLPEDIAAGDECAWCRMLIDEPRLPAEFARAGGRVEKFGEPGCLLAWLDANQSAEGVAYVTVEDGSWMTAGDARFSVGEKRTPMAFDIVAYRTVPASAERVDWTDLLREGAPRVRSS